MTIIQIYVTFPSLDEARKIGNQLLEQQLIACANYHPIQSDYVWKGKIESEGEVAASFKTLTGLEEEARSLIEQTHSYEVPIIASWEMKVNDAYYEWMNEVCKRT